eukprot:scaffold38232_cov33-Phaeocystis_antarctica.AAC.1
MHALVAAARLARLGASGRAYSMLILLLQSKHAAGAKLDETLSEKRPLPRLKHTELQVQTYGTNTLAELSPQRRRRTSLCLRMSICIGVKLRAASGPAIAYFVIRPPQPAAGVLGYSAVHERGSQTSKVSDPGPMVWEGSDEGRYRSLRKGSYRLSMEPVSPVWLAESDRGCAGWHSQSGLRPQPHPC